MDTERSIGRYQIQGLLGRGAMGEVYRARDPVIDRSVAIKIMRRELTTGSGSEQLLERFRREARAAGRRFHPNIVAIWDFGDDNGRPFLVMELVDGRGLDQIIKSSGRLELSRGVPIIMQVLSALGFAHENGIVHRDIKPSNIMVLQNDHVKVADFGIARIDASEFTIVGDLLGTPAYMAPEQLTGGAVDHRTDLFAAGVILFEMLTGVKPFRGKSITEIMSYMEKRGPEDIRALNPAVPDPLKRVIIKSVAFDAAQRYSDAAQFSQAIAEAVPAPSGEAQAMTPVVVPVPVPEPRAQTASGGVSLRPDLLREIERDLATYIGPMASIVLKRSVTQTSDVLALYELLGRHVSNSAERAIFLANGRQRAAAQLDRLRPASRPRPEKPAERRAFPDHPAVSPNRASLVSIEADLTRYIGPIARILVKRELEKFESLAKFCLVLAAHIPDEKERRAFLDAHGAQ
jgi:eukaryotic-like serine/threonine-protein kinase